MRIETIKDGLLIETTVRPLGWRGDLPREIAIRLIMAKAAIALPKVEPIETPEAKLPERRTAKRE